MPRGNLVLPTQERQEMSRLIAGLRRLGLALLMLASVLPAMGCIATTKTSAASAAAIQRLCGEWKIISWSRQDTEQTVREIKEANASRSGACGK